MNPNNPNDVQFFEPDDRFGQKLDFNTIIMRQIDKVRTAGSVEWMGGYWERKPYSISGMSGAMSEEYVPDTREVYINSVDVLFDLLLPYFDDVFDKEFKDLEQKKEKTLEEKYDEIKHQYKVVDEEYDQHQAREQKGFLSDKYNQQVLEFKVEHQRSVFWELLKLIKRQGLIDTPGVREVA